MPWGFARALTASPADVRLFSLPDGIRRNFAGIYDINCKIFSFEIDFSNQIKSKPIQHISISNQPLIANKDFLIAIDVPTANETNMKRKWTKRLGYIK